MFIKKMFLSKIHSKYLIPQLFLFIKENKMFKINKGNSFLIKIYIYRVKNKKYFFSNWKIIVFIIL